MSEQNSVLVLRDVCVKNNLMLAVAESCTGGGVAFRLTEVAGSSAWFDRGFVTYSNEAKMELLKVSHITLREHGAVSAQVVREMAVGALRESLADCAIATTGIAGPSGGSEEKPVGTVWFGFASKLRGVYTQCVCFSGDRQAVRAQAIDFAMVEAARLWQ